MKSVLFNVAVVAAPTMLGEHNHYSWFYSKKEKEPKILLEIS